MPVSFSRHPLMEPQNPASSVTEIQMASNTQPSTIEFALAGWRDALRAIKQMISVVGAAFLLTVIAQAAYQLLRGHSFVTDLAIVLVVSVAQSLVLTPLALAVHRFVLLDEVTQHYALNLADQRVRRFFGVVIAIQALCFGNVIWFVVGHFMFGGRMFWGWGEPITPGVEGREWVLAACFAACMITVFVTIYVMLSVIILFPAIAIDAPGVGWRNAMFDSNLHIGRITFASWLALVPLAPLAIIADPQKSGFSLGAFGVVLRAAYLVLIVCALAAVASRLYMAFGRRLNGVAPVA
jgi:hypothetical protein